MSNTKLTQRQKNYLVLVHHEVDVCGYLYFPKADDYAEMAEDLLFAGYLGYGKEGYYLTEKGLEVVDQVYGLSSSQYQD